MHQSSCWTTRPAGSGWAGPAASGCSADLAWEHSAPVLLAAYERLWQTPGGAYAIALEQRSADRSAASRTSP